MERLRIKKILNNNSVVSQKNGQEIIVLGNGIGWKNKIDDWLVENSDLKIYRLETKSQIHQFELMMNEIPYNYIELTEKIIENVSLKTNKKYQPNLVILLADHIFFLTKRYEMGIETSLVSTEEIRTLYPEEYRALKDELRTIENELGIILHEDEASMLTFHFVNASSDIRSNEATKIIEGTNKIVKIIEENFQITLDKNEVSYSRLIIHLKFFLRRVLNNEIFEDISEPLYLNMNEKISNNLNKSLMDISKFLEETFKYNLIESEKLYLTIHVLRNINKGGNSNGL